MKNLIYWGLASILFAFPFVLLFLGLHHSNIDSWLKITIGAVAGIIYVWFYATFFLERIEPNKVATVLLFGGKPLKTFTGKESPLAPKIPYIMEIRKDEIEMNPDPVTVSVITSNPESAEFLAENDKAKFEKDDLHRSTEAEIDVTSYFRISKEHHFAYIQYVGSIEDVMNRIKTVAKSFLTSKCSTVTTVMLLDPDYLKKIEEGLKSELCNYTDKWGIEIIDVKMTARASQLVLDEINKVATTKIGVKVAEEESKASIIRSEAEKKSKILVSEGEAAAIKNVNDAKLANTRNIIALAQTKTGKNVLRLQTFAETFKNLKFIGDGKTVVSMMDEFTEK